MAVLNSSISPKRAREKTKRILKEHEPEPLEPEVDKELEKTIKELEKKRM